MFDLNKLEHVMAMKKSLLNIGPKIVFFGEAVYI